MVGSGVAWRWCASIVADYTGRMGRIETARLIAAPVERVFDVVAHAENFREAVPEIVGVEFLTEASRGAGARFRETRRRGGGQASVELEVVSYERNDRVTIVAVAAGTIWSTSFQVTARGDATELRVLLEDRPNRLLGRLMAALVRPMVRRAVARDLDAVQVFCERTPGRS